MVTATPRPVRVPLHRRLAVAATLLVGVLLPDRLKADEPAAFGVEIPQALTTERANLLLTLLNDPLDRFKARRAANPQDRAVFTLVCDFNPDNQTNNCDNFGACYTLAKNLDELKRKGVRTVAFVHAPVSGHAVLPVLACTEVVMSREARLGKVTEAARPPLNPVEQGAYLNMAGPRRAALVRKLFDPNAHVFKVHKGDKEVQFENTRPTGNPRVEEVDLPVGDTVSYTFSDARNFGLCEQKDRDTREALLADYQLSGSVLFQPLDRIVPCRIVVKGALGGELREKVKRRVRQALGQNANLIILQLECVDGDPRAAQDLGQFLAGLNDNRPDRPVVTIAFVTTQARNTAAFLAFGCSKIVLQKEKDGAGNVVQQARLGGDFDRLLQDNRDLAQPLRAIAKKRHPLWDSLAAGLVSPEPIYPVERKDNGARSFKSNKELQEDDAWKAGPAPVSPEVPLTLTAEKAEQLGVASTAPSFEALCAQAGVNPADVRTIEYDWLDQVADVLRDPWVSALLVMVGFTCLILEMKIPGVVAPGCIAAICFVLLFWSHSQLSGQITWLALLLFILGLLLIGLEIFVVPGFGFAGISGIVLVVGSLGLVAYGHWPQSQHQWMDLAQHVGPFCLSLLGAIVCAFLLARYLPSLPYVNRLILQPQGESEDGLEAPPDPAHAELAALLGAIGVAATPLRPAGKAQFGDAFVDVVAEGTYVVPGTRVQVIEIEGNRVVVKEV
jgi:hypothetical protein